jgi:hypothetical protein
MTGANTTDERLPPHTPPTLLTLGVQFEGVHVKFNWPDVLLHYIYDRNACCNSYCALFPCAMLQNAQNFFSMTYRNFLIGVALLGSIISNPPSKAIDPCEAVLDCFLVREATPLYEALDSRSIDVVFTYLPDLFKSKRNLWFSTGSSLFSHQLNNRLPEVSGNSLLEPVTRFFFQALCNCINQPPFDRPNTLVIQTVKEFIASSESCIFARIACTHSSATSSLPSSLLHLCRCSFLLFRYRSPRYCSQRVDYVKG